MDWSCRRKASNKPVDLLTLPAPVSVCPNLGGSEAEGGGDGVGALPVLQHQPPVLGEGQVVTGGQVPQSEGLSPADVAPAPAVKVTDVHRNEARRGKKLTFSQ